MKIENLVAKNLSAKKIDLSPGSTSCLFPADSRIRLIVLKKGQLQLNVEQVNSPINGPILCLIPNQTELNLQFSSIQELSLLIIEFYLTDSALIQPLFYQLTPLTHELKEYLDRLTLTLHKKALIHRGKPVQTYDREITSYFQILDAACQGFIRQLITAMLEFRLLKQLPENMQQHLNSAANSEAYDSIRKSSRVRYQDELVNRLINYMEGKLSANLSIEDLAQAFYLSPSTIKKRFKQATNKSVMVYYRDLKMERAKQWIREGKLSYTIIAEKLGYYSIHHFSSTFKKQTGYSPTKYFESKQANFTEQIKATDKIINESRLLL